MFGMLPFDRSDNNLFNSFDAFTRDFFRRSDAELPDFRTDIQDTGDSYLLEAELPGFNKEDITLDLKDNILTIQATHESVSEQNTPENGAADSDNSDVRNTYIRRERRYGSFRRSFDVSGIDESGIQAAYRNGVLTLTLPKAKPAEPETRHITIE
jgi:HSP20 family protein